MFCADSALALWIKWVPPFSLGSWGETEAVPSLEFPQAAGTYHSATIQFSHKTPSITLSMSWHKKHTHVPSKGKCITNDTFPTRCGICCGQDKPEGSGYTQTLGVSAGGSFIPEVSSETGTLQKKKNCCSTDKTGRKLKVNLTPPRNWESLAPVQQGGTLRTWMEV